jgi:hypothetical protein
MSHKKLSRNAPCPCGSGKKYKHCCWGKGFEYVEDEEGTVFRSTPMTPEVREALEYFRQAFVAKHGQEPGPDDLLFPDMPHPEHLEARLVEDMKAAGIDPAIIYAFEKTGLLVTEQNQHLIPEKRLDEWDAAVREYEEKHGMARSRKRKGKPNRQPEYPIGTVALYGPDDKTTTKIAAGVILHDGAEPILKRWVGTDVTTSLKVQKELQEFFRRHGVRSVGMSEGNMGCPHEEGEDFPAGEDCPFRPFWKGKQGSNRRD